jgi:hypothetical protein
MPNQVIINDGIYDTCGTLQQTDPYRVTYTVLATLIFCATGVAYLVVVILAYSLREWSAVRRERYLMGNLEIPDFANKPRPTIEGLYLKRLRVVALTRSLAL